MRYQFRIDEEFNLNTVFFPVWDNTSVSTIQFYFIVLHLQNLTGICIACIRCIRKQSNLPQNN